MGEPVRVTRPGGASRLGFVTDARACARPRAGASNPRREQPPAACAYRNAKIATRRSRAYSPPIGVTTNVRGEPASGHPIRRGEVASPDHKPETRSKREKHPPRHASDYAAYRATATLRP